MTYYKLNEHYLKWCIYAILFIKGMESLFSRRLLREHFKIIWKDMLGSYKSSGKQINYIRKVNTRKKKSQTA